VSAPGSRASYLVYRAGADIARRIPGSVGEPMARVVARSVGMVLMGDRARQVGRNLERVHGPGLRGVARTRAVAATFDSYGRYFYELFRLPHESPAWVQAHFSGRGTEHIAGALATGRGAVCALPHLGNWDFGGAWLSGLGFPLTVVAEPVEPPQLFDWFVEVRRRLGMEVVPLSGDAGGPLLRALRANRVVCLLADRDLGGRGVEVEFFGERTTLPAGPAVLALRSGAPLIPVGCYFLSHGRHEARILPPLPAERTGRLRDDVARVTQLLAHRFEDLIRAAPEQWHLMQPNWPSDRPGADRPCAPMG
jgi:lauroyl/myristoyl acyltransferase